MAREHDDDVPHDEHQEMPTVDKPLHGPRRGPWKPLLVTVLVFAVLIALYLIGVTFLVPAD